jgi:hypothetical protein
VEQRAGRRAASRRACCAQAGRRSHEQAFLSLLQHGPSRGGVERELDVPATLDVLRRSGAQGKMQARLLAVTAAEQSGGSMCWSRRRDAAAGDGVPG